MPSAFVIETPAPAVSVLPFTLPALTATIPVAPVRSATAFNVDALAVILTPLRASVPLIFAVELLNC